MYVAGYTFYVLNNVFANHWEFQYKTARPEWRAKQVETNHGKFVEFAHEVCEFDFNIHHLLEPQKQQNPHLV